MFNPVGAVGVLISRLNLAFPLARLATLLDFFPVIAAVDAFVVTEAIGAGGLGGGGGGFGGGGGGGGFGDPMHINILSNSNTSLISLVRCFFYFILFIFKPPYNLLLTYKFT